MDLDHFLKLTLHLYLGSTDKTLNDNWRMIWEAGISNIVMVTNLMEESKVSVGMNMN